MWAYALSFEQEDGSYNTVLREDLIADPVIEWAYRKGTGLQTLSQRLQELGLPIDRGNSRYPQS